LGPLTAGEATTLIEAGCPGRAAAWQSWRARPGVVRMEVVAAIMATQVMVVVVAAAAASH
jgi:hypothetical protein